ncbi:MAG: hypothetical protein COA58_02860 [Bacteroidetes bacterium]|nr:MAG: hypothetical protein COA58_02860 [Bacteroidota bacterium]
MKDINQQIEKVVTDFNKATATQDIQALSKLLHRDYRVSANRFKGSLETVIISRDAYLDMMETSKIGGTVYEISLLRINQTNHTASVDLMLTCSDASDMHKYLFLVQGENDNWQIIGDLPLVIE